MYWDGEASNAPGRASRPCTTHEESFISRVDHTEEMSFIQGMGNRDVVPNLWCNNLTIDKKFEYKNSKAMEGNLPYQYETTEESIGDAQKMFNGHN